MILLDSWAPLAAAQGGVLIVAIPATDAVFYVGEDTPKAIDALRTLTKMVLARAPGKLSGNLYRWRASGWERWRREAGAAKESGRNQNRERTDLA